MQVAHFDPHNEVSSAFRVAGLGARLRQGFRKVAHRIGGGLKPMLAGYLYLLFFDGGSRGNPGPGGCGSVIVQVGDDVAGHTVRWVNSISLAKATTTKNYAENMGLLTGLRECMRRKWSPLHVIGDSEMIIRQQRARAMSRAKHLRTIYWRIQHVADQIAVISWNHHLREYNRTAVIPGPVWDSVYQLAPADVGHWLDHNLHESVSALEGATS
ncbi:hypothetical protein PHMEG_00025428 [Phytophthora megakarya]|uniref:RNase H type-1 domain-containing protein n=1 Tax=Phytophthora megakarya TaxID=4795 RepID=A0A225VB50_9STRA|nr:hypothetical protein PHMEG_00025428 [Phytophthora megakarya]